jgi:hypothetical protein
MIFVLHGSSFLQYDTTEQYVHSLQGQEGPLSSGESNMLQTYQGDPGVQSLEACPQLKGLQFGVGVRVGHPTPPQRGPDITKGFFILINSFVSYCIMRIQLPIYTVVLAHSMPQSFSQRVIHQFTFIVTFNQLPTARAVRVPALNPTASNTWCSRYCISTPHSHRQEPQSR